MFLALSPAMSASAPAARPQPSPEAASTRPPREPLAPLAPVLPLSAWSLLVPALDEIDYGVVVVDARGAILHLNRCAKLELDATHPLRRQDGGLVARRADDDVALQEALHRAARGLRQMLSLGEPGAEVSVSVAPLRADAPGQPTGTLLLLGKRRLCDELSLQGYSRERGLTGAEERVLRELCRGDAPAEIARRQGVAISTVRTQILQIRAKTGTASIRDLVGLVATLPPCRRLVEAVAA